MVLTGMEKDAQMIAEDENVVYVPMWYGWPAIPTKAT